MVLVNLSRTEKYCEKKNQEKKALEGISEKKALERHLREKRLGKASPTNKKKILL